MKAGKDAVDLAKRVFNTKKGTFVNPEYEALMSTTARAGAGGTRIGVPGLRPSGLKKANDLIDYFTPGKVKMPDRPFSREIETPADHKNQDTPFRPTIMLPRSYCGDCDRKGRPEKGGAINFNVWAAERADLGVKPGDSMISFFCQECVEKYQAGINDPGKDILEASVQGVRQRRQAEGETRAIRCKENQENYIRAMRLTGNMAIYTDGRK